MSFAFKVSPLLCFDLVLFGRKPTGPKPRQAPLHCLGRERFGIAAQEAYSGQRSYKVPSEWQLPSVRLSLLRQGSVLLAIPTMLSLDFLDDVLQMNKRQLYYQVLNFGMIVSSALMIWKGLMVITGSESPIVVLLSGSMEPAFHRGDLLFLTNQIHEKQNGHIKFLTKGDNNAVDDRGLYKQEQHLLEKKDVVGRARGFFLILELGPSS
ncbi:hypothetical protein H8959_003630 [Pygathrix nigripes]